MGEGFQFLGGPSREVALGGLRDGWTFIEVALLELGHPGFLLLHELLVEAGLLRGGERTSSGNFSR